MPPELAPFLEYGVVGVVVGVLYLLARLYHPQAAQLIAAVAALPRALGALTAALDRQGAELHEGLGAVRAELAVIKDRLPRHSDEQLLEQLLTDRCHDCTERRRQAA